MLFVCHSSLDRETIVKPLLYYLYEFGIDIWYDHKKLFLSDKIPIDIYKKGIIESSDILIVFSKNLPYNSVCGKNELTMIYQNQNNKNLYPVLYNCDISDFKGKDYELLRDTIHFKVDSSNLYQVAVQIAIKIIEGLLNKKEYKVRTIDELSNKTYVSLYYSIPPFSLREKVISLLSLLKTRNKRYSTLRISEINIETLIRYFDSLIKLNADVTENDTKLMDLLTILIIGG